MCKTRALEMRTEAGLPKPNKPPAQLQCLLLKPEAEALNWILNPASSQVGLGFRQHGARDVARHPCLDHEL